jgi:hypothetical protein
MPRHSLSFLPLSHLLFELLTHITFSNYFLLQLGEAEWYAETYSIRSEQHFALLLFWVHAEVMRRSAGCAYRQALLRSRRLQFKKDQNAILAALRVAKMDDSQMKALITPEDDSEDGIVLGARARVRMQNTIRTFTASRGITKIKGKGGGYKVVVTMPPQNGEKIGVQKVMGTYATNVEAALVHDVEIRRLWPEEKAERMVNMNPENTKRVSLLSETTPLLMKKWPDDEKAYKADCDIFKKLGMVESPSRHVKPLHIQIQHSSVNLPISKPTEKKKKTMASIDAEVAKMKERKSGVPRPYRKNADCDRWGSGKKKQKDQ